MLPPELRDVHLVVDAAAAGNVARFINHGCEPNCLIQPVFARAARSTLHYYVAVVANTDIPACTELTYHYNYMHGDGANCGAANAAAGMHLPCHCGTPSCTGRLL